MKLNQGKLIGSLSFKAELLCPVGESMQDFKKRVLQSGYEVLYIDNENRKIKVTEIIYRGDINGSNDN